MLRWNHIILHSDDKENWIFEEWNFVLKRINLIDIEISFFLNGSSNNFECPCDDNTGDFGVFLTKILNEWLEALKRRVEDCGTDIWTFAHVQQTSDCAHGPAPKCDGRDLGSVPNVLNDFIEIILLIESKRNVVTLGVTTATKVKGAKRDVEAHEIAKIFQTWLGKKVTLKFYCCCCHAYRWDTDTFKLQEGQNASRRWHILWGWWVESRFAWFFCLLTKKFMGQDFYRDRCFWWVE